MNPVKVSRFWPCRYTRAEVKKLVFFQQCLRQCVCQCQVLEAQERGVLQEAVVQLRRHAVAGDVGDVARFLPAVVQQPARLVVGAVQSVALFKEAVVVHHPAVGHPTELCRQRKALPGKGSAEAARPRRIERLAGHHLVAFVEFGGQLTVFGVPQGVAVGRDSRRT